MLPPELIDALAEVLGDDGVLHGAAERVGYERDGGDEEGASPELVLLPRSTEEVAAVLRILHDLGRPFVPRGAGTGRCGGAVPYPGAILVCTSRMNRTAGIDAVERRAVVDAGVSSSRLQRAASAYGLFYAPGDSGCGGSTVGGALATNAIGRRATTCGTAAEHVLGVELALADGEVLVLGGLMEDVPGYDLVGLGAGSEGTLGVVTRAVVRLHKAPPGRRGIVAGFPSTAAAAACGPALIRTGIAPAHLEILDTVLLDALRARLGAGFFEGAGALLVAELHGRSPALDERAEQVSGVLQRNGACEVRLPTPASDPPGTTDLVALAVGALGRLAPCWSEEEGLVPRTRIAEALREVTAAADRQGLRVAIAMRPGDGLVRAFLAYDRSDPEERSRVRRASLHIARALVALGGAIVGDNGVGIRKTDRLALAFTPEELALLGRVRDAFDPAGRCNPGKLLPRECGEESSPCTMPKPE